MFTRVNAYPLNITPPSAPRKKNPYRSVRTSVSVVVETKLRQYSRTPHHIAVDIIGHAPSVNQTERVNVILQLLVQFDKFMRTYKLPYWITYGTALGAWRAQHIIPWDDDGDVGILYKDIQRVRNASSSYQFPPRCILLVVLDGPGMAGVSYKFVDRVTGVFVDVWAFKVEDWSGLRVLSNTHVGWTPPPNFLTVPVSTVFPLQQCMIEKKSLLCANDLATYVIHIFQDPGIPKQYRDLYDSEGNFKSK